MEKLPKQESEKRTFSDTNNTIGLNIFEAIIEGSNAARIVHHSEKKLTLMTCGNRIIITKEGSFEQLSISDDWLPIKDWESSPKVNGIGWNDMIKCLKNNKKMKRQFWIRGKHIYSNYGTIWVNSNDSLPTVCSYNPTIEDVEATDWVELKESGK